MEYIVYVTPNENSYITAVNSSAFLPNTTDWMEIDRGSGDCFHHAQNNYFEKRITTDGNAFRYKLVDGKAVECSPEEISHQEEANKPVPVEPEGSVWDELDAAYQSGYTEGYQEGVNAAYDE